MWGIYGSFIHSLQTQMLFNLLLIHSYRMSLLRVVIRWLTSHYNCLPTSSKDRALKAPYFKDSPILARLKAEPEIYIKCKESMGV